MKELATMISLAHGHDVYMSNRIDLIASNSLTSQFTRFVMGSSLPNSYCIGLPGARLYGGCAYIDMIEREVHALAKQVFNNMKFVVVQFLSGMQANIGAYNAVLKPGDSVIAASTKHGGHYSHTAVGPLRFFSPKLIDLPFDDKTYNVDLNQLESLIKKERPKLLILGWSEFLFPHPLKPIKDICQKYGVRLMYDMSHVVGLIAGGVFQPDATTYADIVTSSTGKSLHAPDHGLIMYNDEALNAGVLEAVMPLLTSNTHPQEVATLGVALSEMLHFGHDYAKQVVANAKALAVALEKEGLHPLYGDKGYTESHTVLLEHVQATTAVTLLDRAGILLNACQLPWDAPTVTTGLRLGTQVLTRHGYKEKDMPEVASYISQILVKNREPEVVHFKYVQPMAKKFQTTAYSFDDKFPSSIDLYGPILKSYAVKNISAILRSNPAFANCSMEEIESIEKYFTLHHMNESQRLFKAGDNADAVYFVADGVVNIVDDAAGSVNVIVDQRENSHFGELGVITGNPRKFSAVIMAPTVLLKIKADDFLKMLRQFDTINHYFNRYIVSLNRQAQ